MRQLFFIPFENQLLVMGFAIFALPPGHQFEEEDFDALSILQRLAAVSIYNAWLFRDLSEQRDTLQKQAKELEHANVALRDSDRTKSEFLALTSHELRTPLTGILGFTRLVLDGLYTSEADMKQMLMASYSSGKHLLELLNDILDLAKIESGKLEVNKEPFSLGVVVADDVSDEVLTRVAAKLVAAFADPKLADDDKAIDALLLASETEVNDILKREGMLGK